MSTFNNMTAIAAFLIMTASSTSAQIDDRTKKQQCCDNTLTNMVSVQPISEQLAEVRDYVPLYAVIAHRGSTYWAPEETESAWRWAREMGADYLESDLQCSKDGVIIANHDDNLKRTTNIEALFGADIPSTRIEFYESLGFSHDDAVEQFKRDTCKFPCLI